MSARILPHPESFRRTRQKQPRERSDGHLARVRQCPCLSCGSWRGVEAAHLRSGDRRFMKPAAGGAEKPSDHWCTPLCRDCHREQHTMNELEFWRRRGVDPFVAALALWEATDNLERMQQIVMEARIAAASERSMA